jgi:excisionase family DNA binding protein
MNAQQDGRAVMAVGFDEAARLLGISKRTLERLRDKGEIHTLRIGRHWKVRTAELESFLRREESKMPSPRPRVVPD